MWSGGSIVLENTSEKCSFSFAVPATVAMYQKRKFTVPIVAIATPNGKYFKTTKKNKKTKEQKKKNVTR